MSSPPLRACAKRHRSFTPVLLSFLTIIGVAALGGCPPTSPPAGSDAPSDGSIGAEGGKLEVKGTGTELDGMKVIVPPGAIPAGERLSITIGRYADGTDDVRLGEYAPLESFAQMTDASDDVVADALWGAVLQATATPRALSPVIEFGPAGAQFDPPLEVRIPFDLSLLGDPPDTSLVSFVLGDYANGVITGERLMGLEADESTGELVVYVPHFSYGQLIANLLGGALSVGVDAADALATLTTGAIAGTFRSIWRTARDLPDIEKPMIEPIMQQIVCSAPNPTVDLKKLPNALELLFYLANVPGKEEGETDAEFRQKYVDLGLVTGLETALEDWVIAQPAASIDESDVFGEAYRRTNGDLFQALLLSHNVCRGWDGETRYSSSARATSIKNAMAPVPGSNDSVGDRYHLFGTALFAVYTRLYAKLGESWAGFDEPPVGLSGLAERLNDLAVYYEECYWGGECLRDEFEFAYDRHGQQLGYELVIDVLTGYVENGVVHGVSRDDIADRFTVDNEHCLDVAFSGETTVGVGEYFEITAEVSGGTPPYGVVWAYLGDEVATGPVLFSSFDTVGEYTFVAHCTDSRQLRGRDSVLITVTTEPEPGDQYLVYYTDNVRCWDAPLLYIATRSQFEAWRSTASYPGGGIDSTQEAIKVELKGGFENFKEAQEWVCPQFISRYPHYWCSNHYYLGGQYYVIGNLGCDLSDLPVDTEYRE